MNLQFSFLYDIKEACTGAKCFKSLNDDDEDKLHVLSINEQNQATSKVVLEKKVEATSNDAKLSKFSNKYRTFSVAFSNSQNCSRLVLDILERDTDAICSTFMILNAMK